MSLHDAPSPRPAITGAILAGGRGRRMGGADKGLVEFAGRPLIAHVIEALRPQVEHMLISANRNIDRYTAFGFPVIRDELENHQGPLAGFAALLAAIDTDWLVTAPCDGPHLPRDLVARLWHARSATGTDIAVAHDGRRLQPVHALLHRNLLSDLRAYLAKGDRKIDLWYARYRPAVADFSDCADAFLNLNTPEDHHRLEGNAP